MKRPKKPAGRFSISFAPPESTDVPSRIFARFAEESRGRLDPGATIDWGPPDAPTPGILRRSLRRVARGIDVQSSKFVASVPTFRIGAMADVVRSCAKAIASIAWLAVPKKRREEVEGDFYETIEAAKARRLGRARTRLLVGLVVARYAVVAAWFVFYRVIRLLSLWVKLTG